MRYFLLFFLFLTFTYSKQDLNSLSIIMAGDALIHSRVYNDAQIVEKNSSYDFSKMLTHLSKLVASYDLAFYNQESLLGGKELGISTYPNFNSPKEFGKNMTNIGFNLVSLANNHSLDKGEKGVLSSLDFWRQQNSTLYAGSYISNEDKNEIKFFIIDGIKIALLAYTYGINGHNLPSNKPYLVSLIDKKEIEKDIKRIRKKVDLLLVSMHWGDEYIFKPNKEQRDLAKFLSSLGVDVIIGTHSHFIAPIEFINDTLVIYSLGNLLSAQNELEKRVGLLVGVVFEKKEDKPKIRDFGFELSYTYRDKNDKNFKIYPFRDLNESILTGYKDIQEKYENIVLDINKSIKKQLPR